MKVAILSESPADESAVRVLVEAILGGSTEPVAPHPRTRPGGWPSVLKLLPAVLRYLHYQTPADALVVVVDSNNSPVASDEPRAGMTTGEESRLVQLQRAIAQTQRTLRAVRGRAPVKTAVGLAVPAVEAWYLCGRDPNVSENAWVQGLASGRPPYSKDGLKRGVYGTDRPSLPDETRHAGEAARRLATDLEALTQRFPVGFGALAHALGEWGG